MPTTFFSPLLFMSLIPIICIQVAAEDYYDHYLLDCGYNASRSTPNSTLEGRSWSSDDPKYFKFLSPTTASAVTAVESYLPVSEIPFRTARVSQTNFSYTFPVKAGPKFIRLFFYRSTYSPSISPDKFFFSVVSNTGSVLLQNFSATGPKADISHEFFLTTTGSSPLRLTFAPSLPSYYAFVNGIEIVSASQNLLYEYAADATAPMPSLNISSSIQSEFIANESTSFQTMYRLNVGGPLVQVTDDSGKMYRRWDNDNPYAVVGGSFPAGQPSDASSLRVNYTEDTPEYVAPKEVYLTCTQMGKQNFPQESQRAHANLTWKFEVDAGFSYLLRLHWCEIDPTVESRRDRVFDVFINNQTATMHVDLMEWGIEVKGVPMFRDYVIHVQGRDEGTGGNYLWLVLHPSEEGFVNVILNGLEIFKVNKSDGSLAAPNPSLDPIGVPFDCSSMW